MYLHSVIFNTTVPNFAPSSLKTVATTSTNVTLTWEVPSSSPDANGYVFYYSSSVSGSTMSVKVVGGSVGEHTLEGLSHSTWYTISIRAYQDILGPESQPIVIITNSSRGMFLDRCSIK